MSRGYFYLVVTGFVLQHHRRRFILLARDLAVEGLIGNGVADRIHVATALTVEGEEFLRVDDRLSKRVAKSNLRGLQCYLAIRDHHRCRIGIDTMTSSTSPKRDPKSKGRPHDDPERSRLFIEKAREVEADEMRSAADKLMGRLAKMKP